MHDLEVSIWKQGDIHPETGKVYWSRQASCKNGERWMTPEQYKHKKDSIKKYLKTDAGKAKTAARRNTDIERLKRNTYAKTWRSRPEQKEKFASYARSRRRINHLIAISERMRARLRCALNANGFGKKSSTNEIIGCDWPTFISYLESKFDKGMSWENRNEWEIDHIIPLSFGKSELEIMRLSHYTNIQPLWKIDNRRKGSKIKYCSLSAENHR